VFWQVLINVSRVFDSLKLVCDDNWRGLYNLLGRFVSLTEDHQQKFDVFVFELAKDIPFLCYHLGYGHFRSILSIYPGKGQWKLEDTRNNNIFPCIILNFLSNITTLMWNKISILKYILPSTCQRKKSQSK
jgi:hypothetical protein